MDLDDMVENWHNGNRKDVVMALIANGKLSEAIEFASLLTTIDDRNTLVKMLQNRDK